MERKLIQLAKKTLVVSIPNEIVKKFNLSKKDVVNVNESGENIVIKPSSKPQKKKITLDIKDMNKKLIKDLLLFSNTLGYDEITISYDEHTDLSFIEELTNQIEGIAVMKQTKNSSTFKHISKESATQFDEILERAFDVTNSLAENTLEIIKKGKYKNLKNLLPLEYSNNKLTSYCSRILLRGDYSEPSKIPFLFTINWNLEIIADFYRRICYDLATNNKKNKKLSPDTIECIEKLNELFLMYYNLFKKLNTKGIIDSFNLKNKLGDLVEKIFDEKKGIDVYVAHYVIDIATFIQDSISLLLAVNKLDDGTGFEAKKN